MRRIHKLIEDGDIEQLSRSVTGKSYYPGPAASSRSNFIEYAMR